MRRVALLAVLVATPAGAAPWTAPWSVTAEGGGEVDTNVQRVETGPGLDTTPISSPVLRFGARANSHDKLLGGSYALDLSDLTRIVDNTAASVENVTMFAGDLRFLHPVGERPVAAGIGLTAVDAFPLSDAVGARTFRNLGADGLVALRNGDERRLLLAFGARAFTYKPDHTYDYTAPAATARLDWILWQPASKTRSLELAATLNFEARAYDATALVNVCPQHAAPNMDCSAGSDLPRRDRYQRAGLDLTWVGREVLSLGYQLTVIDSNSYGQSLARHRVIASGTIEHGKVYATLLAILQIDQYLDGLLVLRDLQHADVTNIEDENRSSVQLRLARKLSDEWSLEGRAAYWRNIAGGSAELAFQRTLIYVGAIYSK